MTESKRILDEILIQNEINPNKCMKCGKCTASCPAYDEMEYHPHQFVQMAASREVEPLFESDSIYRCLSCYACVERCPRNVQPGRLIEAIRLSVFRKNSKFGAENILDIADENVPQQLLCTAFRKYTK